MEITLKENLLVELLCDDLQGRSQKPNYPFWDAKSSISLASDSTPSIGIAL